MSFHSIGYLFKEGIKGLWKNRTMSIASICVLISCLLMTGIAGLLSINLSSTMKGIEGRNTVTVFLDNGLPALTAVQVGEEIRALDNVSECTFVPKEDGLKNVIGNMDSEHDSDLMAAISDDNPLPDAYTISLSDLGRYKETIAALTAIEGVDKTDDISELVGKLNDLDRLVKYVSLAILLVLGLVSLFIISNTLKVTIFSRRMEINIMKSVGATNGFVRIPFIVEGVLIDMFSGLISASVLYFGYDKAVEVVYGIVKFLDIIDIRPYALSLYLAYVLMGMLFGIMGGVISIRRYLKHEGENAIV